MEAFSLVLGNGWNSLKTLLAADNTFKGQFLAFNLYIRNTHATATMLIKPGSVGQPASSTSGINLTVVSGVKPDHQFLGQIQLDRIWIFTSAAGSCDLGFTRASGGQQV